MFVIVYQNRVILGPMRWIRIRYENVIFDECEVTCSLPEQNTNNEIITVNDDIKIYPVVCLNNPEYDIVTQHLVGPYYNYLDTYAEQYYVPGDLPFEGAKVELKKKIEAERWAKQQKNIDIVINNTTYSFPTDDNTRSKLQQLLLANVEEYNWKFNIHDWVILSKTDVQNILASTHDYIQSCFTWEYNKYAEVDNCTELQQLKNIDYISTNNSGV